MHITLVMKKIFIILFFLLSINFNAKAQYVVQEETYFIERLNNILANKEKIGFKKCLKQLKEDLSRDELKSFPKTLIDYLFEIQDLSLQVGARDGVYFHLEKAKKNIDSSAKSRMWEYLNAKGKFYLETIEYKKAKLLFEEALKMVDTKRDLSAKRKILQNYSNNLRLLKKYDEAIDAAEECATIAQKFGDAKNEMQAKASLGNIYFAMQFFPKAAELYNKAYLFAKENNYKQDAVVYASKMSELYMVLGQFKEAIKYSNESLQLAQEIEMDRFTPYSLLDKSKAEYYLGKFIQADESLAKFSEKDEVFKPIKLHCQATILRAKINWVKGDKERARKLYTFAENECVSDELASILPDILLGRALYYSNEKKYEEALLEIKKALLMEVEDMRTELELKELRASIFEKSGSYKQAYYAVREKEILLDTLVSMNRIGLILAEESKKEIEQSKFEIQQLESEKSLLGAKITQRRNIILGLLGSLIFLGIVSYFYSRNRKLSIEKELAEVKQNLLRIQINPHFIFNTLASIQSSFLLDDKEKTIHLFNKFSNLMRQVLENSEKAFVPLNEEIEMLVNYLELEKVRTNNKFDYAINIGEGVDIYNEEIPSMILQIFIENSIWHGIIPKEERGLIELNVSKINSQLKISLEDNGVGRAFSLSRKSKDQKKKKSMGTNLVVQRVQLLNLKYNKNLKLDILDGDNKIGTKVLLAI